LHLSESRETGAAALPPRIALIGFMGSGKTTTGRALAERLGYQFVDTDDLILQATSARNIPELFTTEGEARFRDCETTAVRDACATEHAVIATGGGVPLRSENIDVLRDSTFVVWLTVRPEVVVGRTQEDAASRPLLAAAAVATAAGDPGALHAHVLSLIAERGPRYQAGAHCIVDASDRSPQQIAADIQRKAERWLENQSLTESAESR